MFIVSRLAQLVERVTSNDEVSRSSRLMGIIFSSSQSHPGCLRLLSGLLKVFPEVVNVLASCEHLVTPVQAMGIVDHIELEWRRSFASSLLEPGGLTGLPRILRQLL